MAVTGQSPGHHHAVRHAFQDSAALGGLDLLLAQATGTEVVSGMRHGIAQHGLDLAVGQAIGGAQDRQVDDPVHRHDALELRGDRLRLHQLGVLRAVLGLALLLAAYLGLSALFDLVHLEGALRVAWRAFRYALLGLAGGGGAAARRRRGAMAHPAACDPRIGSLSEVSITLDLLSVGDQWCRCVASQTWHA